MLTNLLKFGVVIMSKILVDIPDEKSIQIRATGVKREKYVYKVLKFFRTAKGSPSNQSIIIGKYDVDSGKMFPNKNYYERYGSDNQALLCSSGTICHYGYSYLITKIARDIGLTDILSNIFGKHTDQIIIIIAYVIRMGCVMDEIKYWSSENFFPLVTKSQTSQSTSRFFESITDEQKMEFFRNWIKLNATNDNICYDVTSISSYSKNLSFVEYGYNRDNDLLEQYNIGLFCNQDNFIPLYYNEYNCSLTDKTNLSYVLNNGA